MSVVGHKRPPITERAGSGKEFMQPLQKIITVLIVFKYSPTFNTTNDDVVQNTWYIKANKSWHVREYRIRILTSQVNYLFMDVNSLT